MEAEKLIADNQEQQFCGFYVAGNLFAVPVLAVQEVIKPQKVTPVPLANSDILGLLNLRGQIVTLLDLRSRLGLPRTESENSMFVIVRVDEGLTALSVDEISDVITVNPESFEEAPDTLEPKLKKYVSGVYKLKDQLLVTLDLKELLKI